MIHDLCAALSGLHVDYADIRYDSERRTKVALNGSDVEQMATYSPRGGYVRAYVGGGKATATFSRIEDARATAEQAAVAARILASYQSEAIALAKAPVVQESFAVSSENDPRKISLSDKHDLLRYYNQIALAVPEVQTTQFTYADSFSHRCYANTEGTAAQYEHLITHILGTITGRRGSNVQQVVFAIGGSSDFERLLNREDDLRRMLLELNELVDSKPVMTGSYPVVLDPSAAAIFIHEAFGHRSEADALQQNRMLREKMALGAQIGSSLLNVWDDPMLPDRGGSYPVDDEGVLAAKTDLIVEGCISGRLHSRETAAEFGEPLTGSCRASDAGYGPVVRMSNTVIGEGTSSVNDMIASIDDGYYVAGGSGGQGGIDFALGARWARHIRKGRLAEMVSNANLSGNLFTTLKAISMVGDSCQMLEYCDCGKSSPDGLQMFSRVCAGAPHLKIDSAILGGA